MSTTTGRLGLHKPASDGLELVSVTTDVNGNLDIIDLAVGFRVVTSSTRPSTPYSGQAISQSDTAYSSYFSNGTAPASGSWVEVPNSTSTFAGAKIRLSSGTSLEWAGDTNLYRAAASSLATDDELNILRVAVTDSSLLTRIGSDTFSRYRIRPDGLMEWGSGSAARDTNLYRSAANSLATDDDFAAANLFSTGWKSLTAYGSFQNLSSAGATAPQVQDVTVCGLKLRFFQGVINFSGVTTASYTFFSWNAGYQPSYERDWGVGGAPSTAAYRSFLSTGGNWGITGQATSQTSISLDQFSPVVNPPGTL